MLFPEPLPVAAPCSRADTWPEIPSVLAYPTPKFNHGANRAGSGEAALGLRARAAQLGRLCAHRLCSADPGLAWPWRIRGKRLPAGKSPCSPS